MQVGRESVSQLAGIRREVQILLLEILDHLMSSPIVASKLAAGQMHPLTIATLDRPQKKVWNGRRNQLRE